MFDQYLKSTRNKIISAVLVITLVLITVFMLRLKVNREFREWLPKTNEIILEYGSSRGITESKFIDVNDKVEVNYITIDIPLTKSKKDESEIYQLGTYEGVLKVQAGKYQQEHKFFVTVIDTEAPKIIKFSERVVVGLGYQGDFREYFEFEDVDDVRVDILNETINTMQVGHYKSEVRATDGSNNITQRDFIIEVVDGVDIPTQPIPPIEDDKEEEESVFKSQSDINTTTDIAFGVKRIADSSLYEGQERIEQEGVAGKKQLTTRIYYENNVEVKRELIKETIIAAPQDQIVYYGTKPLSTEIEGAFGENPVGLIYYETLTQEQSLFGKEYYERLDESIVRGEDLMNRNLIDSYEQGVITRNGIRYYFIVFKL